MSPKFDPEIFFRSISGKDENGQAGAMSRLTDNQLGEVLQIMYPQGLGSPGIMERKYEIRGGGIGKSRLPDVALGRTISRNSKRLHDDHS